MCRWPVGACQASCNSDPNCGGLNQWFSEWLCYGFSRRQINGQMVKTNNSININNNNLTITRPPFCMERKKKFKKMTIQRKINYQWITKILLCTFSVDIRETIFQARVVLPNFDSNLLLKFHVVYLSPPNCIFFLRTSLLFFLIIVTNSYSWIFGMQINNFKRRWVLLLSIRWSYIL